MIGLDSRCLGRLRCSNGRSKRHGGGRGNLEHRGWSLSGDCLGRSAQPYLVSNGIRRRCSTSRDGSRRGRGRRVLSRDRLDHNGWLNRRRCWFRIARNRHNASSRIDRRWKLGTRRIVRGRILLDFSFCFSLGRGGQFSGCRQRHREWQRRGCFGLWQSNRGDLVHDAVSGFQMGCRLGRTSRCGRSFGN